MCLLEEAILLDKHFVAIALESLPVNIILLLFTMLYEVFKSAVSEKKKLLRKRMGVKNSQGAVCKMPKLLNVREIACRE